MIIKYQIILFALVSIKLKIINVGLLAAIEGNAKFVFT